MHYCHIGLLSYFVAAFGMKRCYFIIAPKVTLQSSLAQFLRHVDSMCSINCTLNEPNALFNYIMQCFS
jgi:hypothetical protein